MSQEYFSIQLSPEINLGIPLEYMGGVVQLEVEKICPIPGVKEYWYGVANYQGSLLWVLNSDRYFNFHNQRNILTKKITAVIISQKAHKSSQKVALETQKLVGITTLEIDDACKLDNSIPPQLKNCVSSSLTSETNHTYILNSGNLLQQLQQSALVSA